MGLATARIVGRDHTVVLCDVRQDRLEAAAATLEELGIAATIVNCDVTDRRAVVDLMGTASGLGTIASVIHTAGVSPSMGDADYVMKTNAVGTLNVNEVFHGTAGEGAAIVNVASMAAHLLPEDMVPTAQFPLALRDEDAFTTQMATVCGIVPEEARSGTARRRRRGSTLGGCASSRSRPDRSTPRWAGSRNGPGRVRWSPTPRSRGGERPKRWPS
jgi:NAD(P)-dependent dehydrogenase (short-subunit alcohol dehydrogenase family)